MAKFRIGTSGWQYDHWRSSFYPRDVPKKDWFNYYAAQFDTVEINNSFYRQPSDATWDRWHDEAPPGFRFAVKANRYITHMKQLKDCEEPLRRFFGGAERLKSFLGPVLFQMPQHFQRNDNNIAKLKRFLSLLPRRHRQVFEFRHDSWFNNETFALLREHGAGFCVYDMPNVDCPVVATASHGYIRFHGSEEMYGTNYTDEILGGWSSQIKKLALGLGEVWIYFNNDAHGYAPANALRLREMLGD